MSADDGVLRAPHVLEYEYERSVGPVIGAFMTGLRDGKILGAQSAGKVVVPPTEYDPFTGEDVGDLVEVGPGGEVTSWTWAASPTSVQPLDRPFAWALVKLDGATTAMLHVVDAGGPESMHSGMRVTAHFLPSGERNGNIRDIECFVPEAGGGAQR